MSFQNKTPSAVTLDSKADSATGSFFKDNLNQGKEAIVTLDQINKTMSQTQQQIILKQKQIFEPIEQNIQTFVRFYNSQNPKCSDEEAVKCIIKENHTCDDRFKHCGEIHSCHMDYSSLDQVNKSRLTSALGKASDAEAAQSLAIVSNKLQNDFQEAVKTNQQSVMNLTYKAQTEVITNLKKSDCHCNSHCLDNWFTNTPVQSFAAITSVCNCHFNTDLREVKQSQNVSHVKPSRCPIKHIAKAFQQKQSSQNLVAKSRCPFQHAARVLQSDAKTQNLVVPKSKCPLSLVTRFFQADVQDSQTLIAVKDINSVTNLESDNLQNIKAASLAGEDDRQVTELSSFLNVGEDITSLATETDNRFYSEDEISSFRQTETFWSGIGMNNIDGKQLGLQPFFSFNDDSSSYYQAIYIHLFFVIGTIAFFSYRKQQKLKESQDFVFQF